MTPQVTRESLQKGLAVSLFQRSMVIAEVQEHQEQWRPMEDWLGSKLLRWLPAGFVKRMVKLFQRVSFPILFSSRKHFERRILPVVGVCYTSSHLHILTSVHLHIYTVYTSVYIFSLSLSFCFLHIFTSSHLSLSLSSPSPSPSLSPSLSFSRAL